MSEKNTVEIVLDGNVYSISGTESKEYMNSIVQYISKKEEEVKGDSKYNKIPSNLKEYMIKMNMAEDYIKSTDALKELNKNIEKKNEELYSLKRELARAQTEIARISRERKAGEGSLEGNSFTEVKVDFIEDDSDMKIAPEVGKRNPFK